MSRMLSYVAAPDDAGQRLDALLAARGLYPSRSAAARAVDDGLVFVNGAEVAKKHPVAPGDTIVYQVEEPVEPGPLRGQPIDLDIRFEDEDLIVLSKQVGLVCHPSVDHDDGTLVNALIYHCGAENLCNVQGEDDRLGIVHRLDRDTSGLLIVAKNDFAHQSLSAQLADRSLSRVYEAVVHGGFRADSGTVNAPIGRHPVDRKRMAVTEKNSRHAVTHWEVIERYAGFTHIRCKLETGRTHQIRVHMAHIGHPLLGDMVYGAGKPEKGLEGQCLHARTLKFIHPRTGEHMELTSPLPEYFTAVLARLGPPLDNQ